MSTPIVSRCKPTGAGPVARRVSGSYVAEPSGLIRSASGEVDTDWTVVVGARPVSFGDEKVVAEESAVVVEEVETPEEVVLQADKTTTRESKKYRIREWG